MKIEKKAISACAIMMRALSNETRLGILYTLHKKPKTWDELIFAFKLNPKSLRDHLIYLKKTGLVKKRDPKGFELTDAAKAFVEMSLNDIISTAKQAAKIARRH